MKLQHLERQASIEKQQVFEDAFIEQMNYYIQHGKTEGNISCWMLLKALIKAYCTAG